MIQIKNILLLVLLICSYNSFGQWIEIENIEEQVINTLSFLDDDLGYVLMNNDAGNTPSIMKTVDSGDNWTELNLPTQTGEFQDIDFYAEGKGVLLIRDLNNDIVPTVLFRTVDDGANWEDISPVATATGVGVGQCQFLNENIGFLATDRFLYTTTDGGVNWTSQEFDNYLLSIDFLDAEHGILGTWDGTFGYMGGMLTTSDGGLTWTNNVLDEVYTSIGEVRQMTSSIAFAAPVHSWAAIQAGQIYKTIDGGLDWNVIAIPMPTSDHTLRQIDFKDEMNGVICVGNTITTSIYHTTDGGQTWIEEGVITSTYNSDLQLTPNSGFIGGKVGSFYRLLGSNSVKEVQTEVDIALFPSPSKSGNTISWNSTENFTELLIIDKTGATIHRQALNENQATLPTLTSGLYFVQLLTESISVTTKLVVE